MFSGEREFGGGLLELDLREAIGNYLILTCPSPFLSLYIFWWNLCSAFFNKQHFSTNFVAYFLPCFKVFSDMSVLFLKNLPPFEISVSKEVLNDFWVHFSAKDSRRSANYVVFFLFAFWSIVERGAAAPSLYPSYATDWGKSWWWLICMIAPFGQQIAAVTCNFVWFELLYRTNRLIISWRKTWWFFLVDEIYYFLWVLLMNKILWFTNL